jgi:hypothetical protein
MHWVAFCWDYSVGWMFFGHGSLIWLLVLGIDELKFGALFLEMAFYWVSVIGMRFVRIWLSPLNIIQSIINHSLVYTQCSSTLHAHDRNIERRWVWSKTDM